MKQELEGVKVGDKLVCRHNYGSGFDIHVITRLTKTLAVCGESTAFALATGKKRGTNSWNSRWAKIPTEDDLARIELEKRVRDTQTLLSRVKVTAETLDAAEAFLKAVAANKEQSK